MTPRTLDLSQLQPFTVSSKSTLWLGQLLLCLIEGSMFLLLIAMYFYLRLSVDVWPPPGTQLPHLTLPTIALVPLLLSAVGSWIASEGAKKDSRREMLQGMILNVVLGFVFLTLRAAEMWELNFNWATDVHGSVVWSILVLHSLDTFADLVYTAVLIVIVARGQYGQKQRIGVHVDSVVWYFIVAIWIPLYLVVYWGPHIVGAPQ